MYSRFQQSGHIPTNTRNVDRIESHSEVIWHPKWHDVNVDCDVIDDVNERLLWKLHKAIKHNRCLGSEVLEK